MRRRHMPEAHATHPNVTPLIDVVMCLIIFFMLVAKIGVSTGADSTIDVPVSILGQDLKDPGNALTLNVRRGPGEAPMVTALVDNTTNEPQELKILDVTTGKRPLFEVLKRLRDGDPKSNLPANPEFKVIIRGERDMAYRYLEPVLIACMEAKVKTVNFNTKVGETQ
jgi:biopolymer transport protein ExbD